MYKNPQNTEKDILLESERLILRRFTERDWMDLYEYLSLENVVKYEPYDVQTENECKLIAQNRATNNDFWAVCLKESGKVIGNIYFSRQEPLDFLTWEVGYVFNPNYGKQGYATEATQLIINYGFQTLGAHRIMARCNPQNIPSWKLMERVNMTREGHFRKPAFFTSDDCGNPIWHDAYQYAIIEDDFSNQK
ncbi:GNAT family protein [Fusibacter bizertensis]|uniref:GNAT family protein n=1 Tax=Fusibacter bizertensis TaxID=1488331 RepID=A0ABT6NGP7_9FIRM|nr:GNAT family protein [Fusibacter bizertensis]MDH8679591.1 GNAT family protein [Fusibacter bizertensis]